MNFEALIQQRQSVRKYSAKPVEKEKLMKCIEAARLAPSASNAQPWTFIVVDDTQLLSLIAKETRGPLGTFNNFVASVPVLLVMVLEKPTLLSEMGGRLKKKEYPLIDIGIAAEHFCLQAAELGLGTCMIGWFNEKDILSLLKIPDDKTIGLIVSLGYAPDGYPLRKKARKSLVSILRWNAY
ncbi:MAG: NAD(P)H nitroreductase [Bacteroidetes bacterium HGW-Bacteroidetes-1]|jgi:nitroreductase|nr:MAG: NAD(P)H nitroreductase [Bacteroidetes bacterium HGW-Bacteroidetes-1]